MLVRMPPVRTTRPGRFDARFGTAAAAAAIQERVPARRDREVVVAGGRNRQVALRGRFLKEPHSRSTSGRCALDASDPSIFHLSS